MTTNKTMAWDSFDGEPDVFNDLSGLAKVVETDRKVTVDIANGRQLILYNSLGGSFSLKIEGTPPIPEDVSELSEYKQSEWRRKHGKPQNGGHVGEYHKNRLVGARTADYWLCARLLQQFDGLDAEAVRAIFYV